MFRTDLKIPLIVGLLLLAPVLAMAQTSVSGAIRDSSGAALPGVTVEASSPVLIEKVRTAVSDATGQYRIIDLRPGLYTITVTLPGFNTIQREGVELSGERAVTTINFEMSVGGVTETLVTR